MYIGLTESNLFPNPFELHKKLKHKLILTVCRLSCKNIAADDLIALACFLCKVISECNLFRRCRQIYNI